jgi:hypothetical protein
MTPLDDLVSAAGRVAEITPGQLRHGRAALGPAIAMARTAGAADTAGTTGAAGTAGAARRRPAGYGLRRKFALGGIAVAACAALIAVPVIINTGGAGAEASAATLLRAAGNAAAQQPGGWPDAAYWDVVSVYKQGGNTHHREIWVSHHGTSVLRDDGVSAGVLPLGPGEFPAGGTSLTWDQLYALPTDPGQLTAALQAGIKGAGPDPQSELFTIVGDLLRESPAPPALRKALFDVAAGIPGVHLTGKVTDGLGRTGTGVTRGDETLVVDPADGALLADSEAGWTATYVSQGPASSAPMASSQPGKGAAAGTSAAASQPGAAPAASAPGRGVLAGARFPGRCRGMTGAASDSAIGERLRIYARSRTLLCGRHAA